MELIPANTPAFLSIRQFRELTGLSRNFAYRLVREGELRAVRLGERGALRISKADLEHFLRERFVL